MRGLPPILVNQAEGRRNGQLKLSPWTVSFLDGYRLHVVANTVRSVAPSPCSDTAKLTLVGVTAWGELLSLPSVCGTPHQFEILEPWGTSTWPRSWLPSEPARQILDECTGRAR